MKPIYETCDFDIEKILKSDDYSKAIDLMSALQIMRYALIFPEDKEIIKTKMELFLTKYIEQNERSN